MRFHEKPDLTIDEARRHLEVLKWCNQRSPNIKEAIKGTQKRIDELLFEQETNELERSGAT